MEAVITLISDRFDQAIDAAIGVPAADHPAMQDGMRAAGSAYLDFVRRRFQAYADGGGDWAPLAVSTIQSKSRRGRSLRTGFDAGDLYASLEAGGPDNLLEVDGTTVRAGSANPHADYFHSGTDRMPPRPVIVDPDRGTVAKMERIIAAAAVAAVADVMQR